MLSAVDLEVLRQALTAVPEEMGVVLVRSAYSPNIKERRDASCAVFDARGRMVAQAEHIPVHLGSMPLAVEALLALGEPLGEGDAWAVNDPYSGGSHLPDITVISPVHAAGALAGFVVSKAHHADVGGPSPGSMDPTARTLEEEGVVIPLQRLVRAGEPTGEVWERLRTGSRTPAERLGDLRAQLACNSVGAARLRAFVSRHGASTWDAFCQTVIEYSHRRMELALGRLRPGTYTASDVMEAPDPPRAPDHDEVLVPDLGELTIALALTVGDGRATFDLAGTSPEVDAPVNAPYSVTLSAIYYAVRAMTDPSIPPNHGCYLPVEVRCPRGSLLDPTPPHPVSAGNVETSQRVADVCLAALGQARPEGPVAMSQGTMNNLLIGTEGEGAFTFYETIGGGEGGSPWRPGMSGVHTHMTNTANTPVEALEAAYPLRVRRLALRRGTGGAGRHPGGEGIAKEVELLAERAVLTVVSGRRRTRPRGAAGGADGEPGRNALIRDGVVIELPSMCKCALRRGDVVAVETPGGGGWGEP